MPVSCSDLPACGTLLNSSCAIRSSPGLTMRPLARFRSPKVRVKCKSWGLSPKIWWAGSGGNGISHCLYRVGPFP